MRNRFPLTTLDNRERGLEKVAIKYEPSKILRRMVPKAKAGELVSDSLTLNRSAVRALARTGILSPKKLETIAVKVINQYKDARAAEIEDGASRAEATAAVLNDKKLMVQRVQSAAVHEITRDIKSEYRGEFYVWLPSTAVVPDPLHQLNYGKTFQLGVGEMPGDRYGCQCGMNILVKSSKLEL